MLFDNAALDEQKLEQEHKIDQFQPTQSAIDEQVNNHEDHAEFLPQEAPAQPEPVLKQESTSQDFALQATKKISIGIQSAETESKIPPASTKDQSRLVAKLESKIEEKETQISALKKSVKELNSKNSAQDKTKQHAEKELEKATLLVTELNGRITKQEAQIAEQKLLQTELLRSKETISSLTKSLEEARLEAEAKEETLVSKIQLTSLDNQEAKTRLLRFIADKKELEDKITSLSCEKATLTARLQSLAQKSTKLAEVETILNEQLKEVTQALESATEELEIARHELVEAKALSKTRETKLEEFSSKIEELENKLRYETESAKEEQLKSSERIHQLEMSQTTHDQELAVAQACLQEQSQVLEEEQRKYRLLSQEHIFVQKRTEEQENHLRLLEQHLARRVKECALLSKQLEDLMDRSSQLQITLAESSQKCTQLEETIEKSRKTENALRLELDSQANLLQDELQAKDEECLRYQHIIQQKENELTHLRHMQSQFAELENLVKRSAQIFTLPEQNQGQNQIQNLKQPLEAIQTPSYAEPEKDFFAFATQAKPQPKSLFE